MPRQTQRSIRGRQPYVEAFPALDALAIRREVKAGRSCCQWTNEQGLVVGHVTILALSEDVVTIRSTFLGAVNAGRKLGTLRLMMRSHQAIDTYRRPSLVCPDCGHSRRFLYIVAGHWSCRICHDLISVSQLLGNVTSYLRRLQELAVLIEQGRPHRGRKARFAELEEEYWCLLRDFEGAPPLPAELRFAQYPEWLMHDDPQLKLRVERGDQGYGWTRFDEGGFRRLGWLAEQELKRHDELERASRNKRARSAVRPRRMSDPKLRQAPFAAGSAGTAEIKQACPPTPSAVAKPFRFDPNAVGVDLNDD